jgi:hypothetical protein
MKIIYHRILGIILLACLCSSCGNSRVDYPGCIQPTGLRSVADGDFVFHDPISPWSNFLTALNPKWSDARVCVEEAYISNFGGRGGLNCYDSHQKSFKARALPDNTDLVLDGFVRVEEPWGIPRFFTRDINVYYRGKLNNDYFWMSIVHFELLISRMKSGNVIPVLDLNKSSLEYLELDSKLKTRNKSKIWPCDPVLARP